MLMAIFPIRQFYDSLSILESAETSECLTVYVTMRLRIIASSMSRIDNLSSEGVAYATARLFSGGRGSENRAENRYHSSG